MVFQLFLTHGEKKRMPSFTRFSFLIKRHDYLIVLNLKSLQVISQYLVLSLKMSVKSKSGFKKFHKMPALDN